MNNTPKYIVRTDNGGIFYGKIKSRIGTKTEMNDVRKLWYWAGAVTLSQLAVDGPVRPEECRFTRYISEITVIDTIEIIPCSLKAIELIESVKDWTDPSYQYYNATHNRIDKHVETPERAAEFMTPILDNSKTSLYRIPVHDCEGIGLDYLNASTINDSSYVTQNRQLLHQDGEDCRAWGSSYGSDLINGHKIDYDCGCGGYYYSKQSIISFENKPVYQIPFISSSFIITKIRGNIARCTEINSDFTLHQYYVVKDGDITGCGSNLKQAYNCTLEQKAKYDNINANITEFFKAFNLNKKYPAWQFYHWHHKLTGSTRGERNKLFRKYKIDPDKDNLTVKEFCDIFWKDDCAISGIIIKLMHEINDKLWW